MLDTAHRILLNLSFLSLFLFSSLIVNAQDLEEGKRIFETNCTACHKLGDALIGPDLTGVMGRWSDKAKLIQFVHNSQAVINSGDAYAKALYAKYNNVLMPPQDLTDAQIENVLAYADAGPAASAGGGAAAPAGGGGGAPEAVTSSGTSFLGMPYGMTLVVLLFLAFVLLVIAIVLFQVKNYISRSRWEREHPGQTRPETGADKFGGYLKSQYDWVRNNVNPVMLVVGIIGIVVFLLAINWYQRAQDLGSQIGYAPEQPIKFNHKLHAGTYGIQCQYCHTGVTKNKNATIPSINTCMNCHNYIKEGAQYGKEEIAKVVSHYENKEPVEWVRIHNLPDHVYFNHSQHVVAGGLDCQNCHGNVKEMERVQQVSTLEMGWCINCHREKTVNSDNPYYTATYDFVKEHGKYTVAQLGGLECAKCHY